MFGNRKARGAIIVLAALPFVSAMIDRASGQDQAQSAKELLSLPADKLVEILKDPKAEVFQKAKACQRLAVVGTKDCVDELAALLPDETLNLYARCGLEGIEDPSALAALRKGAKELKGRPQIGAIDSLGQRKDGESLGLLSELLKSKDEGVSAAAAAALGAIGSPEAADVLKKAVAKKGAAPATAEGCLACADNLVAAGRDAVAGELYQAVNKSDAPKRIKVGAIKGILRVQKEKAQDVLLAQVRAEDADFFNVGLAALRDVPGAALTEKLAGELSGDRLSPDRQARLLLALGDRSPPPSLDAILAATKSKSDVVREAGLQLLAASGDASATAVLLDAALSESEVAKSARERLKKLNSGDLDAALTARLEKANASERVVLLQIAAARRASGAKDAAVKALAEAEALEAAALDALAQVVELADLPILIDRALAGKTAGGANLAQAALRTAAQRMPDREACAEVLTARLKDASPANQAFLLNVLRGVSGERALAAVVASVKSPIPEVKDAATRELGEWVNPDAASALLDIAKSDPEERYQIRALRGYVRIARQLKLPPETRLSMFGAALETAKRDEERKLAFGVLTRIPSAETLELAASHLKNEAVRDAAADAAIEIARKLLANEPKAVAKAMKQVLDSGVQGVPATSAQQLFDRAAGSK